MRNPSWILFVARRYMRERRSSRALAASFLSTAGIAVGVLTLVVVIGVMNGFQLGFIEDILEIRSYDLRIAGLDLDEAEEFAAELRDVSGIRASLVFLDTQTLARGRFSTFEAVEIRGLDPGAGGHDPGLVAQLEMQEGGFGVAEGLILGAELARALGVRRGDLVTLAALSGGGFAGLVPHKRGVPCCRNLPQRLLRVRPRAYFYQPGTGVRPGFGDRTDLSWGSSSTTVTASNGILREIDAKLAARGLEGEILSWREFNRAFFGALRMEKLTMSLLIGVMFLVVAGNIYHSLRRGVQEKRTAIAVLRALGGGKQEIQLVFILEGALIGLGGTFWGLALGLLTVTHIEAFFRALELLSLWFSGLFSSLFSVTGPGGLAITEASFYLTEVPVRLLPAELFLIAFFALSASVLSAWGASRDVAAMQPSSILRYE